MEKQIDEIRMIIQNAIKKKVEIIPTSPLNNIIISSITFVIVLGEIERIFNIEIPEYELIDNNFKNIESIDKMLNRILSSKLL